MLKEGIGDDIYHTHFRNLSNGDFVGWWSPDPLEFMFPDVSPYLTMGGNPISFVDLLGLSQTDPNKVDPSELPEPDKDGYINFEGTDFYKNPSGQWTGVERNGDVSKVFKGNQESTQSQTSIPKKNYFGETPVEGPNTADLFYLPIHVGANALTYYGIGVNVAPGEGYGYNAILTDVNSYVNSGIEYYEYAEMATGLGALKKITRVGVKHFFKSFTKNNFRRNLEILTGEIKPSNIEAHHVFPQKFKNIFYNKYGMNINDPKFGAWWDRKPHRSNSYKINERWEQFLRLNPTYEEILLEGKRQSKIYGFKINY